MLLSRFTLLSLISSNHDLLDSSFFQYTTTSWFDSSGGLFISLMKRVAIFSGSFNPIHIGHLALCNYISEFCDVDEVRLVVSPHNPLKQASDLLPDDVRLQMLRLAISDYPKFSVSDVEFHLPKPSFTYVTLQHLIKSEPDTHFILIIGADNLDIFDKWRNYEWIMDNVEIWVYPRLGSSEEIPDNYRNMKMVHAPVIEISSTFVRQSISAGHDVRFFLPDKVDRFIKDNGLYK